MALSPAVIARASGDVDATLRPLDAVHIATAEQLLTVSGAPLNAFLAYDERLLRLAGGRWPPSPLDEQCHGQVVRGRLKGAWKAPRRSGHWP